MERAEPQAKDYEEAIHPRLDCRWNAFPKNSAPCADIKNKETNDLSLDFFV